MNVPAVAQTITSGPIRRGLAVAPTGKCSKDHSARPRLEYVYQGEYIQSGSHRTQSAHQNTHSNTYDGTLADKPSAVAAYETVANIWSPHHYPGEVLRAYA
ncbi:MAG: hypothetical protein HWE20_12255 [Gammaproteobacteria bacterium]|nr:hypothetical protein [Gammaproteobacteria bacterium]